ncbi:hypothetical protein [Streptomyces bluensis]|uniref:Uncharacterized protein n=1 Tax=Streptomyces bluensis TaxID=33897 RepID=A0ABW6UPL1_9ACTN
MSEKQRPNWTDMRREDFEAPPQAKPAPPGQMQLFEAGPTRAKPKPRPQADCPAGTLSLLDILSAEE